ncbi:hypothetical protein [Micromonospora sp. CPCC 205739]|uniref:hypothetical protein n=1 Tax=Micromonospora sp. CPCC 205739 TaxID=3122404 RepID=UPI002FF168A6
MTADFRGLVNPARPADRYPLLDRNSDPARTLPEIPRHGPVNRPCDPRCQRGS